MTIKIVVLNDFPLFPLNHGGKVRIYNIYRQIAKHFPVTYLSYSDSGTLEKRSVSDNFTVVGVPKGRLHRLINILGPHIFGCCIDDIVAMLIGKYDRQFCEAARSYIGDADVIICSHPYMYPIVKKYAGNRPVIYESLNVEYSLKKSLLRGFFFKGLAISSMRDIEGELVKKSCLVFATSDHDIEELKQTYQVNDGKFYISPNGTDIESYDTLFMGGRLQKNKLIEPPLAVFLGSGHPPNVEAARILVKKIAPSVNGVYFLVCGSVCYPMNKDPIGKNVGLAYMISDDEKVELYRGADLALNPMLKGSGTNLKMLDYMAAGLPVITTPMGARGLELENDKHAIICEIKDFPENIERVLCDTNLREKLSREGRKLVEERYDWKKIADNMASIIEKEIG